MKIQKNMIKLNSKARTLNQALEEVAEIAVKNKIHTSKGKLLGELKSREKAGSTGLEDSFAIPHAIGSSNKTGIVLVTYKEEIKNWKTHDNSLVRVAIALFMNKEKATKEQMGILSKISTMLLDKKIREKIRNAKNKDEITMIFEKSNPTSKKDSVKNETNKNLIKVVAVTSCVSGIAHTYMSAESLEKYGPENNVSVRVEKQGASGMEDRLTKKEIQEADYVILAADLRVKEGSRFNGKNIYETDVKEPIYKKGTLFQDLNKALKGQPSKRRFKVGKFSEENSSETSAPTTRISKRFKLMSNKEKTLYTTKLFGKTLHRSTMTGLSYLIPMIVAGGILSALALFIAQMAVPSSVHDFTNPKTGKVYSPAWQYMKNMNGVGPEINISGIFKNVSYYVFDIGIPVVLAGYVAFAIADKPGIVPGMLGGVLVSKFKTIEIFGVNLSNGGFIGGLFAGFLAGGVLYLFQMIKYHKNIKGLVNLFIFPVFGTIITILGVLFILGPAASYINEGVMEALKKIEESGMGATGLGFIIGALMCIDMGGPINKATLAFAYAAMANQDATIYAAVAAAKITPEFVTSFATWVSPRNFSKAEEASGRYANPILGLAGITEGAIPFVLSDPKRVIISSALAGGIAGAISMSFGIELNAIGAGVFSSAFMGVNAGIWLAGVFGASLIGGIILVILKRITIQNRRIKFDFKFGKELNKNARK